MNKKELLGKINKRIEEQYNTIKRDMFDKMVDRNNINKKIYGYINIQTGEIFTDVYNGWDPINPNPYVFEICEEYAYDLDIELYEYVNRDDNEYYAKMLGIYKEWLESEDSFYDLLESTGKIEEYEELSKEQMYDNLDIQITYLSQEDIDNLDTDDIELK